ncbi:hypothetical protein Selin_0206 [Desulfurispirillum indicum S5]|uniref:Uncharacterized protein n=1 Tax=Desulfurispirillum indicum (strain ATCC BAA-1389 / DSM 22839 / S5) TaxID=653733 RepID=E6W624_DESIS|nr:hypothetical protein [Desulfurispirillum indicum]ADU64963.1 hypothetical protein Selin_0206 [Desulfurispirillum indicum S5]
MPNTAEEERIAEQLEAIGVQLGTYTTIYLILAGITAVFALVYSLRQGRTDVGMALFLSLALGLFWPVTLILFVRKVFFHQEIPNKPVYRKPWEKWQK